MYIKVADINVGEVLRERLHMCGTLNNAAFSTRACAYLPPAAQTRLRLRQWA